jgi:hypothetical protein
MGLSDIASTDSLAAGKTKINANNDEVDKRVNQQSGSPEGAVTANVGTIIEDTTLGNLWIKASGTGNTGWRKLARLESDLTLAMGNKKITGLADGSNTTDACTYGQALALSGTASYQPISVNSGKQDANGYADFIEDPDDGLKVNILAGGANPNLVLTHSDFTVETITSDIAVTSLTDSATNYLFKEKGTDTIVKVAVQPVKQSVAPSHAANLYWIDDSIQPFKVYLSDGASTWTEKYVVPLGHAVCSGGQVTSVVSYAFNGMVSSVAMTVPYGTLLTTFNHNIGFNPKYCIIYAKCKSTNLGYAVGAMLFSLYSAFNSGSVYLAPHQLWANKTTANLVTGNHINALYTLLANGTDNGALTSTYWDLYFVVKRDM